MMTTTNDIKAPEILAVGKQRRRVVVAGGSGFLGQELISALVGRGDEVVLLTRGLSAAQRSRLPGRVRVVTWDGAALGPWAAELEGADAVVNLSGKNVNCRYTSEAIAEMNTSRVASVLVLGDAIRQCQVPPRVWVQAGSLAIYGDAGAKVCHEDQPAGRGIPVETCLRWERAFQQSPTPATRRVWLRISWVLGPKGGALPLLRRLARLGLGGRLGAGDQYVSWIHVEDMVRLFLHSIDEPTVEGVYNATAPDAVTNTQFMRTLRRSSGMPVGVAQPAWLVRCGSWIIGTEALLVLAGRRGVPTRLLNEGFVFKHSQLASALAYPERQRLSWLRFLGVKKAELPPQSPVQSRAMSMSVQI